MVRVINKNLIGDSRNVGTRIEAKDTRSSNDRFDRSHIKIALKGPETVARYYKRSLGVQFDGDLGLCWKPVCIYLFLLPPVFITHEGNKSELRYQYIYSELCPIYK